LFERAHRLKSLVEAVTYSRPASTEGVERLLSGNRQDFLPEIAANPNAGTMS
jgi:hypothetical protein